MPINKILIVDDLIENLKIMVSVFDKYLPHFEVFQTNNPQNAQDIAKQTIPDLIITDWDMPQLSGISLIKNLKQDPVTKEIPIIMATGVMLSTQDLKTAFEAGAIDYVRKPIDPIELMARTNSALLITQYYKELIQQKDQELTENSLYLIKGQEFNTSFSMQIENLKEKILKEPKQAVQDLTKLKEDLRLQVEEDSWYRFNLSFSKVHKNFTKDLTEKHPTITPAELKLCSFIRLGMANKEIASVLNQTSDSVKVSSYRIRKKFNLEGRVNLRIYLSQF